MIRLPETSLPTETSQALASFQTTVDDESTYPLQVSKAKSLFKAKNKETDPVFKVIRKELTGMCSGARRCCYCEDSCADEVEHIAPKSLYPNRCFDWENYLYACGLCNGPKDNQYAVFDDVSGEMIDVSRKRNDPVVPPRTGVEALINPRKEDPLDLIWLDLETFRFVPDPNLSEESREWARADFTVNTVLRLNERELLVAARRTTFQNYLATLEKYVDDRDLTHDTESMEARKAAIQSMNHRTVWQEMKRQRHFYPKLQQLFDQAPEALDW